MESRRHAESTPEGAYSWSLDLPNGMLETIIPKTVLPTLYSYCSWWIGKTNTTTAHRTATLAIIKCWFYFLEFAHLVCSRADFHAWNFRTTFASPKSSEFVSMQTKHSVEDVRVLHRKRHPECRQVSDASAFLGDRYPSAVYCGEGPFKVGQTAIYPYTNWSWIQIEHCIDNWYPKWLLQS